MKLKFSRAIIAGALTIFCLAACKKDNLSDSPAGDSGYVPYITTTYQTASHWVKKNGQFVNTFSNIFSPALLDNSSVSVYLLVDGHETKIDQRISFMNGELWAEHTQTDLKIIYQTGSDVPGFDYLNFKVVVQ